MNSETSKKNNHTHVENDDTTYNYHSSDKVTQLMQTLKKIENQPLLIIIKGYPDPDSIASSLALKYIASSLNIESTILHFDKISHQENKALVKKLGIEMIRHNENFDFSKFQYAAFNDTQTTDLPIPISHTITPIILIDHHKNTGNHDAMFVDIREYAGATCSIYVDYIIKGAAELTPSDSASIELATALMHGIRSDTNNFSLAREIDFLAAAYLCKFADKDLLSIISHQSISAKTMEITQTALQNKDIQGTFLFAGVGFVREEDRDGITQVADYLLRREGIETVVVYAIVGGNYIDASLRTKSHTLDPDKWIKELFGVNQFGKPYGGGRYDKGGFQLPLGVFSKCNNKELLWEFAKNTLIDIFYQKIGIAEEKTKSRTE